MAAFVFLHSRKLAKLAGNVFNLKKIMNYYNHQSSKKDGVAQ
jgi:hypothetical protein